MNLVERIVDYLSEKRSTNWISKNTGLSRWSVSRFLSGVGSLTMDKISDVRNTYRRELYSDLRDTGLSSTQARRFTSYTPESATDLISKISTKVRELAEGWAVRTLQKEGLPIIDDWKEQYTDLVMDDVRESLRNSKQPVEYILDY